MDVLDNLDTQPARPEYAGFGLRFVAVIIDGLIISVIDIVLTVVFGMHINTSVYFFGNLVSLLYYIILESSKYQGTFGKQVMNIKVTTLDGKRITSGEAVIRNLCKIISAAILMIGFIMAAFTEKKQALHDMLAGTLVVRK